MYINQMSFLYRLKTIIYTYNYNYFKSVEKRHLIKGVKND